MKILLILLCTLGIALLLWAGLGFYVATVGWDDPPPPAGLLDDMWWSSVREGLLGASIVVLALFLLKRRKAKSLGALDGR